MQLDGLEGPEPTGFALEDLDVYEAHGGHTLRSHVNTRPGDELRRIIREGVAAAGRFLNRATAQRCVDTALTDHREQVVAWLAGPEARAPLVISENMGQVVGHSLTWDDVSRGSVVPRPVTAVRVVLRRRPDLRGGFTVLTSYPTRASRPRPNGHRSHAQ
jgi:hypothetical protein